ncbi:hypothetical protein [Kitasatospora sp. NPDC097643]|uniref:hypothetical protein n=1 Tax=Kitasatospora sp. NPDC097643 TaxID=3157230 RepID=UPI00331B116D
MDVEGKLATLTQGGATTSYVYDADGNQLIHRNPGKVTVNLGGGWLVGVDDRGDHITMQLGIDLYDHYDANLTQGQLHNAMVGLTSNPEMPMKDLK